MLAVESRTPIHTSHVVGVGGFHHPDMGFLANQSEGLKPMQRDAFALELGYSSPHPRRQNGRGLPVEPGDVALDEERSVARSRHPHNGMPTASRRRRGKPDNSLFDE
jgi:hypothetical protein